LNAPDASPSLSIMLLRLAAKSDIPRLEALNRAAYPELVEDGIVFDAAQLLAQQAVFPEGQLVVEVDGVVRGAIATLVVGKEAALAPHTWSEITSYGTFAQHDPAGDTLYLADIYTEGRGLGPVLYDALFRLCERKRLARVAAGGRLWGYHEVARTMTPAAYVDDVVRGRRKDRVLGSQLRAGFSVRGILEGYLEDWRSASFATLLVWDNPAAPGARTAAPRSLEGIGLRGG